MADEEASWWPVTEKFGGLIVLVCAAILAVAGHDQTGWLTVGIVGMAIGAAVAIVGFVGPPIKARKSQAAIQKRHHERKQREEMLSAEGEARRAAEADELAARILGLKEIYDRGVALVDASPTADQASAWLNEALGPLVKGERWTVLHAPPVHSPVEEPNEIKRRLEDQVRGLRDVITVEESRLYGLKGPTA